MDKQTQLAQEYKEFWDVAEELGEKDIKSYPLDKKETKRDRVERHLIGMLDMYRIRYGDPDQRLQIVDFLEKQLFRKTPVKGEICHLALDMWRDLRQTILNGEYHKYE